jgi:hypothetical protein
VLTFALALALAFTSAPAAQTAATAPMAQAAIPAKGVLAPGLSLGGVKLGDTAASVRARWGSRYETCRVCARQTWLYTSGGRRTGAAVSFRTGRVSAVFTLGAPAGWTTAQGLKVGDDTRVALDLYGSFAWRGCIGYGALSKRAPGVVTSIYTFGDAVYGFALTRPSEPVCQ